MKIIILASPFLLLAIWIFGIYYCNKTALRLKISTSVAVLTGIFIPILSALVYFLISFWIKTKEEKMKISKIIASITAIPLLTLAGVAYYAIGTPEYSLYKLKQAIINNNDVDFNKYFDIDSVARNFDESPIQSKEWIDSLNVSILEIKEENPDKSKDSDRYISTELTGKYLESASVSFLDQGSNNPNIDLHFNKQGSKILAEITSRNIDKSLAIFLNGELVSSPIVRTEIDNGEATISGNDSNQASFIVNAINEEKISTINGFKIRKKTVDGNSAKITIGKTSNSNGFELNMVKMNGRYWKLNKIDTIILDDGEKKIPSPEGEKDVTFIWKYKGKSYSIDEKLYDSYYKFYNSLPAQSVFNGESLIKSLEKKNDIFTNELDGEKTVSDLAQEIKSLGEKNNLNENQIVELVSSFVQTIPYDTEEWNNRENVVPKVDYPYEVLYKNKGICSDKSYLAYSLLRDLGYGVSFFLFQEDQHIAVGVKCPAEYSNYDSGYCFIETTSLGNKIGSTPSLSKEFGTATSKIELSDFSNDTTESESSPLGKIEILNKTDGLAYTGVIDTFNTQKEIDNLLYTIRKMDGELNVSRKDLDNQDEEIGKMVDKLNKLAKSSKNGSMSAYNDYNDLYSDYKKAVSSYEKNRKAFNAKVATRNQLNNNYTGLVKSFYQ